MSRLSICHLGQTGGTSVPLWGPAPSTANTVRSMDRHQHKLSLGPTVSPWSPWPESVPPSGTSRGGVFSQSWHTQSDWATNFSSSTAPLSCLLCPQSRSLQCPHMMTLGTPRGVSSLLEKSPTGVRRGRQGGGWAPSSWGRPGLALTPTAAA